MIKELFEACGWDCVFPPLFQCFDCHVQEKCNYNFCIYIYFITCILSVFLVVLSGSAVIGLQPLPCEQNRENA